jgi:SAM-dependent methyltransferase
MGSTIVALRQSGDVPPLLDDTVLAATVVVANTTMNRERNLEGVNSYARDLGFSPARWLIDRAFAHARSVAWLDLCCGQGRALRQGAKILSEQGIRAELVGVDLVDFFEANDDAEVDAGGDAQSEPSDDAQFEAAGDNEAAEMPTGRQPQLVCAAIAEWGPADGQRFDLITCVHGLHYVGDKLALLARASEWLAEAGLLIADLDVANLRLADGVTRESERRRVAQTLRRAGFTYDARRHRVTRLGPAREPVVWPYRYLGADPTAGPNYSGQPVVDSWYSDAS